MPRPPDGASTPPGWGANDSSGQRPGSGGLPRNGRRDSHRKGIGIGRWWSCLGAIAALLAARFGGGKAPKVYPTGCSTTSFTGSAGYYDQAHLYSLPEDTATLTVHRCYSTDVITSHTLSDTTSIPDVPAADPYIATSATPADNGSVLDLQLAGSFSTGIINNTGHVLITGDVTATGQHRFASDPGSGG